LVDKRVDRRPKRPLPSGIRTWQNRVTWLARGPGRPVHEAVRAGENREIAGCAAVEDGSGSRGPAAP
jgi:hypothetical protein